MTVDCFILLSFCAGGPVDTLGHPGHHGKKIELHLEPVFKEPHEISPDERLRRDDFQEDLFEQARSWRVEGVGGAGGPERNGFGAFQFQGPKHPPGHGRHHADEVRSLKPAQHKP